jgi:hypothetical protein
MSSAPLINLQSTRGLILMWVATDPPRTWTEPALVLELAGMDIPHQRTRSAIAALRARGLLSPARAMSSGTLAATVQGFAAIRAHLPDKVIKGETWPGPGPWTHVPGRGHLTEEQLDEEE